MIAALVRGLGFQVGLDSDGSIHAIECVSDGLQTVMLLDERPPSTTAYWMMPRPRYE